MLRDLLSPDSQVYYNYKFLKYFDLETTLYINQLMYQYGKSNNLKADKYANISRPDIERHTGISTSRQLELDDNLISLNIIEVLDKNYIYVNFSTLVNIFDNEELLKNVAAIYNSEFIKKSEEYKTLEKTSSNTINDLQEEIKSLNKQLKEATKKLTEIDKEAGKRIRILNALKDKVTFNNTELREEMYGWIEDCYDKYGWLSRENVRFSSDVIELGTNDVNEGIAVIRFARRYGYIDMAKALSGYRQHLTDASKMFYNNSIVKTTTDKPVDSVGAVF